MCYIRLFPWVIQMVYNTILRVHCCPGRHCSNKEHSRTRLYWVYVMLYSTCSLFSTSHAGVKVKHTHSWRSKMWHVPTAKCNMILLQRRSTCIMANILAQDDVLSYTCMPEGIAKRRNRHTQRNVIHNVLACFIQRTYIVLRMLHIK